MGYSLFLSLADEALCSLGWQSSRDGVSIKIPVPITSLGWHQEGHPAKKKICYTFHLSSSFPMHASMKMDVKPYLMMDDNDDKCLLSSGIQFLEKQFFRREQLEKFSNFEPT